MAGSATLRNCGAIAQVFIFLTNKLGWQKNLHPRILSVLKKEDMIFEPYDALDLVEILQLRVDTAAIKKIAAYASRETGDARKAVELLSKAVKVPEKSSGHLGEEEVDWAEHSLEFDKTDELIKSLALQQQMALRACYMGLQAHRTRISTGTAFEYYQKLCWSQKYRSLTPRRFSDMVSFLDI